MHGDFSVLNFDPREPGKGVAAPADGVLRNVSGVLHQQGRVTLDADLTEGELLELAWNGQAGRDIIGAGVCAVPASEPQGFRVESAAVVDGAVRVMLRPGRAWADGILARLAGNTPDATAPVERLAAYFGPPYADPAPSANVDEGIRDAVILEVSEEALHGFQYPERLIEPALGGTDTAERAFVNFRVRLLRLAFGEDCLSAVAKLREDPKGRLTASLAPVVAIAGDCPVVGGGGYTGFEHQLYRIEIAEVGPADPPRFKWSQWNGGLVGRGRFDATTNPDRVIIDASRAAIISAGTTDFYLEALRYNDLIGAWTVVYGALATLNTDHDLELATTSFGALPTTSDPVFFRLWNGLRDIAAFPTTGDPVELRDGIRLAFDAPAAGNFRPGDYWTFKVRAGEVANPQLLIDAEPPVGIVYHRVALAEINWTGRHDTTISGSIEDCRVRFRPLSNQKICCTYLVGNGVTCFGDFNSLEEAAAHLPAGGGELCLLPGIHRANLQLTRRFNIRIHGCAKRVLVLPRDKALGDPVFDIVDCGGIEICEMDIVTFGGIAIRLNGSKEASCQDIHIHDTRVVARTNAIRATNVAGLVIASNRLHLLDTFDGRAVISLAADDVLVERNTLLLLPFIDPTPDDPDTPSDDPTLDPADPCAKPEVLYAFPGIVLIYATAVWSFAVAQLVAKQPYRARGGIHVRAGSERVRILENIIAGGAGDGIVLGGDIDPAPPPVLSADAAGGDAKFFVVVGDRSQYLAIVQDEQEKPLADIDVYLEGDTLFTGRSDAQGRVSMKARPGRYALDVAPPYRIVKIDKRRLTDQVEIDVLTLAVRAVVDDRGFLHEIGIEGNDIAMMGLSGIGFALRDGTALQLPGKLPPPVPGNDPKAALLAYIDAALANLALTSLLRATDVVRDLVVRGNRLHHNLRNPFGDALLNDAQFIGRGGISLAVVDAAVIAGNHIDNNGPRAADPVCGVFVGYGENLEITDNVIAANGTTTGDFERSRASGIRGGVYVRFAAALTSQLSESTGRNPALRLHDNRIDQPAGRAVTVYAFGPVSIVNNHLNSELTGRFGFLDTAVGGVLLLNLGGIHRLLARTLNRVGGAAPGGYAQAAEAALPGGETLFDDNYIRLGLGNRSITSQVLLAVDDLGYASNTSSVFRGSPFFANAVLAGHSVRATSSRFREDAAPTISLLSVGSRMNMTALNQADHCIIALPRPDGDELPTLALNNQVLDRELCNRLFEGNAGLARFLLTVLQGNADQLGGTLTQSSFTTAELAGVARQSTATALTSINATQVSTARAYQVEAARLSVKRGPDNPITVAVRSQAAAGVQVAGVLETTAEVVVAPPEQPQPDGATIDGRVVDDRGEGMAGFGVELVDANGGRVEAIGQTDKGGAFAARYDASRAAALEKAGELFARVLDVTGAEALFDKTPRKIAPGTALQMTLVVPRRDAPPPTSRTSLDKLKLDAATQKRLDRVGVVDVEGLLEIDRDRLAGAVGGPDAADKLIAAAKRLLDGQAPAGGATPTTRGGQK